MPGAGLPWYDHRGPLTCHKDLDNSRTHLEGFRVQGFRRSHSDSLGFIGIRSLGHPDGGFNFAMYSIECSDSRTFAGSGLLGLGSRGGILWLNGEEHSRTPNRSGVHAI